MTTAADLSVNLEDLTIVELDFAAAKKDDGVVVQELHPSEENNKDRLPKQSLVLVTETDLLHDDEDGGSAKPGHHRRGTGVLGSLSEIDFEFSKIKIRNWDRKTFFSDYIKMGLDYKKEHGHDAPAGDGTHKTIMLYETEEAKQNKNKFKFLNWPPPKAKKGTGVPLGKGVGSLGPLRYSLMNGQSLPAFYRHAELPAGLMEHWKEVVPGMVEPALTRRVSPEDTVYAYLPVEAIDKHVNDPGVHYHLAGKDAIHLMTQKTTRLLPDTKTSRPCVVKTTHSFGSKGIFIIMDDDDEKEFQEFLEQAGHPTFVVTDFVDIHRNVACHFFMHPDGERVTWFGSNENKRLPDGHFSTDSYLEIIDQESLKHMQLPFVEEVVQYCKSLGFWGFCGIDVLFDSHGKGYLVDINPRVTGSCPALMTLQILHKECGLDVGLFRRGGDINYFGTAEQLWKEVKEYNAANEKKSRVVIHSMFEKSSGQACRLNIGVYGKDMEECKAVLNRFAKPDPTGESDH